MKKRETLIRELIIRKWDKFFPELIFIKKEAYIKGVGRIDIFARNKETLRPVIIELKTKDYNPTQQLLSYQYNYFIENPMLIGINEKYKQKKLNYRGIFFYEINLEKEELVLKKEGIKKILEFDKDIFLDDDIYFEKYVNDDTIKVY